MLFIINPRYAALEDSLRSAITNFDASGTVIYKGRNTLKAFNVGGCHFVVKKFKTLDFLKGVIYTFFRKTKARRSYENAQTLQSRGIDTPSPIAFIESRRCGLNSETFYICEHTDYREIAEELNVSEDFNKSLAEAYGRFAATLHEKGILHYDLNSGNVLFKSKLKSKSELKSKLKSESEPEPDYHFQLIDINRMKFMPEGTAVPMDDCLENLTLFTGNLKLHAFVAESYAKQRGFDINEFVAKASERKRIHDKAWRRRKRITHPFRKD